jgi:hypothetical protein
LGIKDASLCHGSAGVLHIAALVLGRDADVLPVLREHLLAQRVSGTLITRPADRPGLLDGAAGTILALHDHLSPSAPPSRLSWSAALLVA